MLDGRALEASQVEYEPFGKTPLKREPGHPDAEEGPGHEGAQGRAVERPLRAGGRENVEKQPATEFRVLQDNADKFQHNKDLTDRRVKAVEDAGAFRAPTNAARSFNPHTATCSGWGPWTP